MPTKAPGKPQDRLCGFAGFLIDRVLQRVQGLTALLGEVDMITGVGVAAHKDRMGLCMAAATDAQAKVYGWSVMTLE
ncbi:MAG: hypothetical protein WCJ35_28015, partial [Planctomycetota bacterium]